MPILAANNAASELASSASAGATSLTLTASAGAKFPAITNVLDFFYVRLGTDSSNEVVKVTARSSDTLTCSATVGAWPSTTPVALTLCKEYLDFVPKLITADITVTVKSSGGDFTTLASALAALQNVVISKSAVVTIEIDNGTWTQGAPIYDNQISSDRIKITGKNVYTKNLSNVYGTPTGSAGAWSIVITLSDVTNIAVNDYVLIRAASGGTNPTYLLGCHKVTAVDSPNSRITVLSKHRSTSYPSGAVTNTGNVDVIKTVLDFSGFSGFFVGDRSTGSNGSGFYGVEKAVLVGDSTGNGISVFDNARFQVSAGGVYPYLGISGFSVGVRCAKAGYAMTNFLVCSGADAYAVSLSSRAHARLFTSILSGAASDTVILDNSAYADVSSAVLTGAGGTYSINATHGSVAYALSATLESPATVTPAVNTTGNDNSYIDT